MHARVHAQALERVLHRERVHHRGEHAHVVGGDAVHAGARQARAAEDVAAADDDGDLHAHLDDVLQLAGDALDDRRIDAVVAVAQQGLARELHEDPSSSCALACVMLDVASSIGKNPARGGVFLATSSAGVSA